MIHVAFLRAVNLGKRGVAMSRLVELVSDLGHRDVWTFVNSGNVVFEATGTGPNSSTPSRARWIASSASK